MTETGTLDRISGVELEGVLARARHQGWTSLALVSPDVAAAHDYLRQLELPAGRTYIVDGLPQSTVRFISKLRQLSSLALVDLQIGADGARARALASLTALTSLTLSYNQIGADGARARALASLTALTSLHLSNNQIGDDGARALASLTGLTSLTLLNNQIGADGARALASLTGLTSLTLNSNQIGADGARALLEAWSDRPSAGNLSYLDLRRNGDLSSLLPGEALDTTDAQAILAAYRRYRAEKETLQPLNEAKLLLVGNEGAGKTSLVRYLVDNLPRRDSEDPTRGTAIREKIDTESWLADQSGGITLNVWDFGGQVIMRGTHQYFLTRRSLYLLVLDARFEDDLSIYDWLRIIRNRADDSPIIVVINKCDGDRRGPRLPEERIKKELGVVEFIRTSCDKGEEAAATIQALRELITQTLATHDGLKHIHDPFPRPYLRVKEAVAALAKKETLLDRAKFEQICGQGGEDEAVSDPAEQRLLLGTLHDLGVVVAHGFDRDAPAVRR